MAVSTALVALRSEHPAHEPEAELVAVEVHGPRVALILDDGTTVDFDRAELGAALVESSPAVRAA